MSLTEVVAAIEAGDYDAALVHALAAWQTCRHERITAVIEKISSRATRDRSPPKSKGTVEVKQAAWLAYAADRNPSDIDNLLATIDNVSKPALLEARLAALKGRIDPRIAKAMHGLLESPPSSTSEGAAVLGAAIERLVEIADPRSDDAWSRLVRLVGDRGGSAAVAGLRKKMPSGSTRLRAALEEVSTEITDEATLALIEQMLTPARAGEAGALFAAVYANPDDDQPRAVLADLLQEIDDPRGEFIALQLANGKRSKREKELLAAHGHAWLGPIAPLVEPEDLDYERGFVSRCSLRYDRKLESLCGLPEWRTITDVEISSWKGWYADLIGGMPRLRRLRGVMNPAVLPPHDHVELVHTGVVSKAEELMPLVGYPSLRVLHVDGCWYEFAELEAFWTSAAIPRLTEFSVVAGSWLPALLRLGIPRIGYKIHPRDRWRIWIERETVTVEEVGTAELSNHLVRLFDHLEPAGRRVVFLKKPPPEVIHDFELQQILRTFAGVTVPDA